MKTHLHFLFLALVTLSSVRAEHGVVPREMSTDRPDSTESPITVPAGFIQIETEFAGYGRDGDAKYWTFGEFNFKYGLTNAIDLQLIVPTWQRVKEDGDVSEGIGDITLRTKINLWGNDSGPTSLALLPFVTMPSGSNGIGSGEAEAGLIIPFSIDLPAPFSLGLMTEMDAAFDSDRDKHFARWINSFVLGIDVTDRTGTYLEFVSVSHFEAERDWEGYFSIGLTWTAIPDKLQFDGGVRLGVNEAAEDVVIFVGCSTRF